MRTLTLLLLFICISLTAQETSFAPNRIMIQFDKQYTPEGIESMLSSSTFMDVHQQINMQSIQCIGNKKRKDTYVIVFQTSTYTLDQVIELYKEIDAIHIVEKDYVMTGGGRQFLIPDDPLFYNRQWSMFNDGTFPLTTATDDADIDMDEAWDITTGDENIIIAVIDSGLRYSHPEFQDRIWENAGETIDGIDNDGNGYIDDILGWDFAYDDDNPVDDHGHGTNVTSILGMKGDNNIGYAGVNWNSQIMTIKALDNANSGFYSWMIDAIYYAVDNGSHVINMSIGGNSPSSLLEEAVNYSYSENVPIVISTGNQNSVIQYPARYENAIAAGSTNPDDSRSAPFFWSDSSGSNFGPEIDYVAPGNYIYGANFSSDTNYNSYWGGTSQAAPHIAGVISLMLSIDPSLTIDQINEILINTSEDMVGPSNEDTPGFDNFFGHGRINARDALNNVTLGLENQNNIQIAIHPNPVSSAGIITVTTLENVQLSIYTMSGQKIDITNEYISGTHQVRFPKLSRGIYTLEITTEKGDKEYKKYIIK